MANARGMIAVDKMGTKVLFLNPVTYETEVVLDGFDKTVHELLVMPETNRAYVPIFGDGIHGRNPNPQHRLCVFDLEKRALIDTIDLRPYIAPHTLKLGPDGLIYITCENSAKVVAIDRKTNKVVGRDRFRLDQRPPPDHRAGRPAALHRERGGRHRVGDRPAEAKAARQDQDAAPARRHRHLGRRPHRRRGRRRRAGAVPDRHRSRPGPRRGARSRTCRRPRRSPAMRRTTA